MHLGTEHPPIRAVTSGPLHHYYDKSPWDSTGRYMLALETSFIGRPPTPDDTATIGLIDLEDGCRLIPLAQTRAWNWQQGCMLQWLPSAPDRLIIYNDRREDRFLSVIRDIHTGEVRTLPLPIYALSHDGRSALTLNFARVARTRPGYGYLGPPDPWAEEGAPEGDGIYRMDLATGEHRLIIPLAQMAAFQPRPDMEGAVHWFNHLLFSPNDRRFIFLHRWSPEVGGRWKTRLFTANPDGGEIYLLADDDLVSHFDWRDPRHILAWARRRSAGDHYFLFTDRSGRAEIVGEGILTADGHCSYSPDRRWILTDTYPDQEQKRTLILFREADGRRVDIGRFYSPPELRGEIRCDLHPRWSRDGRQVCIDSAHEGHRQMYVIDVGDIVG